MKPASKAPRTILPGGIETDHRDGYSYATCYAAKCTGSLATGLALAGSAAMMPFTPNTAMALALTSNHIGEITEKQVLDFIGKTVAPVTSPVDQVIPSVSNPEIVEITNIHDVDVDKLMTTIKSSLRVEVQQNRSDVAAFNAKLDRLTKDTNNGPSVAEICAQRVKIGQTLGSHDGNQIIASTNAAASAIARIAPAPMANMIRLSMEMSNIGMAFASIGPLASIHPYGLVIMGVGALISFAGMMDDDDNGSGEIYNTMFGMMREINQSVARLAEQMHARLDRLEHQVLSLARTLDYGLYNIHLAFTYIGQDVREYGLLTLSRISNIEKQMVNMERLIGDGVKESLWRPIYERIRDYHIHFTRFGEPVSKTDLLKLAMVLENTIQDPPMLSYLNGAYYRDRDGVPNGDIWDLVGWLQPSGPDPMLANVNVLTELLNVYASVRAEIKVRRYRYDPVNTILNQIRTYARRHQSIVFPAAAIRADVETLADANRILGEPVHNTSRLRHARVGNTEEDLLEPFYRETKDIHTAGVYYNDCRSDNVTAWVVNSLTDELKAFQDKRSRPGSIILVGQGTSGMDTRTRVDLTGCYDVPLVCTNPSIRRHINRRMQQFVDAETQGYGSLHYRYQMNALQGDIISEGDGSFYDELRSKPRRVGTRSALVQSFSALNAPQYQVTHALEGHYLNFTFCVDVIWYDFNTRIETKIGVLTCTQQQSTHPIRRSHYELLNRYDFIEDECAPIPHPFTIYKYCIDDQILNTATYTCELCPVTVELASSLSRIITEHKREQTERQDARLAPVLVKRDRLRRRLSLILGEGFSIPTVFTDKTHTATNLIRVIEYLGTL